MAVKPSMLYFIQRGSYRQGSTKFAIADLNNGQSGPVNMEAFAESINTNLLDGEIRNRVILDWVNGSYTIQSDREIDISYFDHDLQTFLPAAQALSRKTSSTAYGQMQCKYD